MYANEEQKHAALAYTQHLNKAKVFSKPIITLVMPLEGFYPAEGYPKNFLERHPDNPYIVFKDLPKPRIFKKGFQISIRNRESGSVTSGLAETSGLRFVLHYADADLFWLHCSWRPFNY
jgi:Peptide methionine sulfoxide reductase